MSEAELRQFLVDNLKLTIKKKGNYGKPSVTISLVLSAGPAFYDETTLIDSIDIYYDDLQRGD